MSERQPQFPAEGGPPPERNLYVRALRIWTRLALLLLVLTFALYTTGLLPAAVPMSDLPRYWSLPADEFVRQTHLPTGWQWTSRLHEGDVMSIISAVFLSAVTGICLLSILPSFARRRDWAYMAVILLQLAVFVYAAMPKGAPH